MRGAKQMLKLAEPDNPLRLRWNDARPRRLGEAMPRAISLKLGNLEPGKYRITIDARSRGQRRGDALERVELR